MLAAVLKQGVDAPEAGRAIVPRRVHQAAMFAETGARRMTPAPAPATIAVGKHTMEG